jgi:hypothetical protein
VNAQVNESGISAHAPKVADGRVRTSAASLVSLTRRSFRQFLAL